MRKTDNDPVPEFRGSRRLGMVRRVTGWGAEGAPAARPSDGAGNRPDPSSESDTKAISPANATVGALMSAGTAALPLTPSTGLGAVDIQVRDM